MLKTRILILRKWTESDAESLFEYAKNPEVDRLLAGLLTKALKKAKR